MEESNTSGAEQPVESPPSASGPAPSSGAADSLEAAIAAANEEARQLQAASAQETPTGSTPPAGTAPEEPGSGEPTPPHDPGAPETAQPQPDDDEPNPALPSLTRGQTRRLFEQWEAERKPRFFAEAEEQLKQTQAEADRLKAESEQRQAEEAAARAELDGYVLTDEQYDALQKVADQVLQRVEANEYVPDGEIEALKEFRTIRDRRRFQTALEQRAFGKVVGTVDRFFRQARVDGVDVSAICDAVSARGGTPADVLALVAGARAAAVESDWKARHEADTKKLAGQLAAEKAAHEATRAKYGLGRAASGESGGQTASKTDVVGLLTGTSDVNAFVERALRGEFANANLTD